MDNSSIRKATAIIIAGSLIGCASPRPVQHFTPTVETRKEIKQNYTIGSKSKAYVGDNIIEKSNIVYEDISSSSYKAKTSIIINEYNRIDENSIYNVKFTDNSDKSLYIALGNNSTALKISSNGNLLDNYLYYFNVGGWQKHPFLKTSKPIGSILFEPINNTKRATSGSFKKELVYTGLDGQNIKVTYREYKDEIARPAFYQDLIYNLKSSDIIRYKNFKIKVEKANNEELEYMVLED